MMLRKWYGSRRAFVANFIASIVSLTATGCIRDAMSTPKAAEGPYYPTPKMRRADIDNNLVKISGLVEQAGGEVITLRGRITDPDGNPRPGHRIEIWQCDMEGNYMHPRDRRSANFDPAFQGFGHDVTDDDGRYVFMTIKPTAYPGRTPHIHVKVFDDRRELLTTQFYIKDHPGNTRDRLFNRMSRAESDSVSMTFTETAGILETAVDIVI